MQKPKAIVALCLMVSLSLAILFYLLMGFPGFLLGAIIGVFAGMMLHEWMSSMLPENRRRIRRMMRHEGLR